jgi:predicted lipoprotein with Yx(FWY)xxD motif
MTGAGLLIGSATSGIAALVLSACGGYGGASSSQPASSSSSVTAVASIGVRSTPLGQILVDQNGMTLYLFEADTGTTSTCTGGCLDNWPPVLTASAPQVSGTASPSLLGTTRRDDGTMQVTYHGHPLYRFAADSAPGDTKGQGLNDFGAGWDVLNPAGNKVDGTAN